MKQKRNEETSASRRCQRCVIGGTGVGGGVSRVRGEAVSAVADLEGDISWSQ